MSKTINRQFEKIFDKYSDVIYRFCLFKTSDKEVAADLTQDVFTKFYQYIQDNELPSNIKSFLYQMTRNRVIDHYRKHTTGSLDSLEEAGMQFTEDNDGTSRAETLTDYRIVLETINKLDEKYREILYMRLVEDYGVSEIADYLEITPSNVSVRLSRGKEQLVKLLES